MSWLGSALIIVAWLVSMVVFMLWQREVRVLSRRIRQLEAELAKRRRGQKARKGYGMRVRMDAITGPRIGPYHTPKG